LAKFKKKISEPTADSNDSKIESVEDLPVDIPQTEKSKPIPEAPSQPSVSVAEKSEKDRKLNQLFWIRVALAIIAGISATFIFDDIEGEERRWASIGFMIGIFFATVIVAKSMKMQLPSSDRKKVVTQAIGSYVFLYLFSWIVSYTLTHLGNAGSGINL
jgi:multidrug transporter EmrE-like cation transporter